VAGIINGQSRDVNTLALRNACKCDVNWCLKFFDPK
jgi:hypothetical protein